MPNKFFSAGKNSARDDMRRLRERMMGLTRLATCRSIVCACAARGKVGRCTIDVIWDCEEDIVSVVFFFFFLEIGFWKQKGNGGRGEEV